MVEKIFFGEAKNVEFTREIPGKLEKFLKDIIAFSNCSGGKVILGIEDVTNVVCGIGNVNPFRLSDSIFINLFCAISTEAHRSMGL